MKLSSRAWRARLTVVVTAAVGLAFGLSGCASEPEIPVPAETEAALVSLASLPADLAIAHDLAQRSCLIRLGFDLPFDSSAVGSQRSALVGVDGLFASAEAARASGYPTTTEENGSVLDNFENSLPEATRAQFREANFGSMDEVESVTIGDGVVVSRSATGCFADADRAVYGSVSAALELENFVNDVNGQSQKFLDDASVDLEGKYAPYEACMEANGYDVDGLNAAEVALEKFGKYRLFGEAPKAEEQSMAASDFICQDEVGFSADLNALFVQKAGAWIVENEAHILALRDELDASMIRARAIVDAS
jgi:hypothetical protein